MKYYITLFALILFGCTSLDENPKGFVSEDNFYRTQNDAIAAVNSIYYCLNYTGQTPYQVLFSTGMDMMTDDVQPGPGATNADVRSQSVLSHSSSGLRIYQIWQQHYAAINRANIAIDKIPAIKFDENLKNRLVLEAKFLRGLFYFNLVRLYGDVPLVLHETTSLNPEAIYVERTPSEQVYQQIINDLTDAESLPGDSYSSSTSKYSTSDAGRATGGAASALLAKVYLTRYDWDNAIKKTNEVITGKFGYDLFANYADVFAVAKKNGVEHIFSAQFKSNSGGHGNNQALREEPNIKNVVNGNFAEQPMPGVFELYSSKDKRRDVTIVTEFNLNGVKYPLTTKDPVSGKNVPDPHFHKLFDASVANNQGESGVNVPIIRFSDVLLMNSEAINEKSGPTSDAYYGINRVRNRAGIGDLTPGLSQEQFRDSVRLDRRKELVFEYSRWFDLIRYQPTTGDDAYLLRALRAVGKNNVQLKHYLFPIPQYELNNNPKLQGHQNPGW